MTRRTLINLALAAVAALLGGLLWFGQPRPPAAPAPLLDIAPAEIGRIEIHPGGDIQAIVLERERGQWRLASPVAARANDHRVDLLLAMAAITPRRRFSASAIEASEAGFERPLATVRFNNAPALVIGAYTPLETAHGNRYLRVGDTAALASVPNAGLLDLHWPQWIDPRLLAGDAKLATLELPRVRLSRADTGGWRVSPAGRDRGADAAQFTADAWRHATALSITAAQTTPAMASVRLTFADGQTRTFEVVARKPQLILREPALGVAYHLRGDLAAPLLDMRHPALTQNDSASPRRRPTRNNAESTRRERQ